MTLLDFGRKKSLLNEEKHLADEEVDALYPMAVQIVLEHKQASASILQRKLNISWNNASRLILHMEKDGVVSGFDGVHPREILISSLDLPIMQNREANLLNYTDNMTGEEFERWCAKLLERAHFTNLNLTGSTGDQGVDITAVKDGVRYAIQCKCYSSNLGNTPVQEVYAGKEVYGCQVAAVMTNRYFTSGATELAEKTRVLLWDRTKLEELLVIYGSPGSMSATKTSLGNVALVRENTKRKGEANTYAYVNGKRLAIALEKSISLNLKPGKHKILFQRAALKSKTLELIVQPSKNYCVNVIPKTFSIDVVIVEMER